MKAACSDRSEHRLWTDSGPRLPGPRTSRAGPRMSRARRCSRRHQRSGGRRFCRRPRRAVGHMIDMPFLTIHLRSRQGQFSVSARRVCPIGFRTRRCCHVAVPLYGKGASYRVNSGNRVAADRRKSIGAFSPRAGGPRASSRRSRFGRITGGSRRTKIAVQSEKLVPQPQDAVACGLLTRNDAPIRSSTKSISEPAR
jgi:hypothetical protein